MLRTAATLSSTSRTPHFPSEDDHSPIWQSGQADEGGFEPADPWLVAEPVYAPCQAAQVTHVLVMARSASSQAEQRAVLICLWWLQKHTRALIGKRALRVPSSQLYGRHPTAVLTARQHGFQHCVFPAAHHHGEAAVAAHSEVLRAKLAAQVHR